MQSHKARVPVVVTGCLRVGVLSANAEPPFIGST